MIYVEWLDKFNLGIREIDEQHKQLIAIINKICNALSEREGDKTVGEALRELQAHALTHFALEEKYFDEFHYEKTDDHKSLHQIFREKMQELVKNLEADRESISIEVISFLGRWFIDHTQSFDRKYVPLFHEHGLN